LLDRHRLDKAHRTHIGRLDWLRESDQQMWMQKRLASR
jgi:hypothetical protein